MQLFCFPVTPNVLFTLYHFRMSPHRRGARWPSCSTRVSPARPRRRGRRRGPAARAEARRTAKEAAASSLTLISARSLAPSHARAHDRLPTFQSAALNGARRERRKGACVRSGWATRGQGQAAGSPPGMLAVLGPLLPVVIALSLTLGLVPRDLL